MMTSEEILLQLSDRLAAMEAKLEHLNELPTLAERIRRIESSLMLVPDVYRYQKLQELLAAGNLREADWETIQVILTITGAADLESITPEDMRRFPYYRIIERFGEQVGWRVQSQWRKCDDLDYTLSAPLGCHPSRWWNSPFGSKMTNYFFARLLTCAL